MTQVEIAVDGASSSSGGVARATSISDARASNGACEQEIQSAALKYGIPEGHSLFRRPDRDGRKGSLYPYAFNIEGKPFFPPSEQDALKQFDVARRSGAKLIDIGCMQINQYYHGENFARTEEMFDPQAQRRIRGEVSPQSA
jgi:hypothetical protein